MLHPPKKQLTCGIGGSFSVTGVVFWVHSSSISDITSFDAMPPKNNQPARLLAFDASFQKNQPAAVVIWLYVSSCSGTFLL